MPLWCSSPPEFRRGDRVVAYVSHPPEIEPGARGTIYSPYSGDLYAVQLPSGELHRWFAGSELEPLNKEFGSRFLEPGTLARITSTEGHPPDIKVGMVVRVIQSLGMVPFYDLIINGKYHRWLAGFEIASENVVQ